MAKRSNRRKTSKRGKSAMKKQIRRVVRAMVPKAELKRHIIATGDNPVSQLLTQQGLALTPTAQGVDKTNLELVGESPGTVVGLNYIAKFINFRFQCFNTDTAAHVVRIIILRDDQPTASGLVLYSATSNYNRCVFTSQQYDSFINFHKPSRFKVLKDKSYTLEADSSKSVVRGNWHINLHNTNISNTLDLGTSDTISPLNREYLMFAICDNDDFVNMRFQSHFCYTDA